MEKLKYESFNNPEEDVFDFDETYEKCFVDINKDIAAPPIALGIG